MYDYRIDKKIDELDPIPDTWTSEQKANFTNSGYLPMSGVTPANAKLTKKVDLATISKTLPGTVWVGNSSAALTGNGTFALEVATGGESSDCGLVIESGVLKVTQPGWYHIEATWELNVVTQNTAYLNEYRPVTLTVLNTTAKANLDMSIFGTETKSVATDKKLVEQDVINFVLAGMGSDNRVQSNLLRVAVHRISAT